MRLERIIQKMNPNSFGNKLFRKYTQYFLSSLIFKTISPTSPSAGSSKQLTSGNLKRSVTYLALTWRESPIHPNTILYFVDSPEWAPWQYISYHARTPSETQRAWIFFSQSLIYLTSQCIFRFYHWSILYLYLCICIYTDYFSFLGSVHRMRNPYCYFLLFVIHRLLSAPTTHPPSSLIWENIYDICVLNLSIHESCMIFSSSS